MVETVFSNQRQLQRIKQQQTVATLKYDTANYNFKTPIGALNAIAISANKIIAANMITVNAAIVAFNYDTSINAVARILKAHRVRRIWSPLFCQLW